MPAAKKKAAKAVKAAPPAPKAKKARKGKVPPLPAEAKASPAPWESELPAAPPPLPTSIPPVPQPDATAALLAKVAEWAQLKARIEAEMKPIIEQEMALRKELVEAYFPEASRREGTNNAELPGGWVLKAKCGIDRKYDEAAWATVFNQLPPGSGDHLIKWVPTVKLDNYRNLPMEHRLILDECIIAKPSSPALELVPPKEKA